jgi:hypothetical protein
MFSGVDAISDPRNVENDVIIINKKTQFKVPDIHLREATVKGLLNVLMLNDEAMKEVDKQSNVFVYMCGHGNVGFVKVQYKDHIFKSDLTRALNELSQSVNKVFVIIDTCQAEGFIKNTNFKRLKSTIKYKNKSKDFFISEFFNQIVD